VVGAGEALYVGGETFAEVGPDLHRQGRQSTRRSFPHRQPVGRAPPRPILPDSSEPPGAVSGKPLAPKCRYAHMAARPVGS
jgi:hypothetical protein